AQKVERVHGDHPQAPAGLAAALSLLQQDLEEHMRGEEQVLFPMMQGGARMPGQLAKMRQKHEVERDKIREIEHLTHGLSLPEGACNSWRALYTGVQKLTDDIVRHIYVENNKLFPAFEDGTHRL